MAWQVEISSSCALETGSAVSDDSGHLKADGINDLIPKIDEIFSLCESLLYQDCALLKVLIHLQCPKSWIS